MEANLLPSLWSHLGDLFDCCLDHPVRATAIIASFLGGMLTLELFAKFDHPTEWMIIPKAHLESETGETKRGMTCVGEDPIAMAASQ